MIKILYFARLRDELNTGEEQLDLPDNIDSISQLREHLSLRGEPWQTALHKEGLLVAVNQEMTDWQHPLKGDEEVAFFPPVTGG